MLPQIEITKISRRVTKFFIRGGSSNTANHMVWNSRFGNQGANFNLRSD